LSIRNLDYLYNPSSVALIGASREAGSIGSVIARNLFRSGFDGPILPVHPHHQSVEGVLAYPDVDPFVLFNLLETLLKLELR